MTKQKSQKQLRQEKIAQEKRKRTLLIWGPVSVIVLIVVGLILYRVFEPDIENITFFGNQARTHNQQAEYTAANLPPTGGSHNPTWQNCGIYDTPVDSSLAVHSLEHGAVWITYRADLSQDEIAVLQEKAREDSYVLLSPFTDQEADVVMTAWSTQLVVDNANDTRIDDFIDRYIRQGPESASCSGGQGAPLP